MARDHLQALVESRAQLSIQSAQSLGMELLEAGESLAAFPLRHPLLELDPTQTIRQFVVGDCRMWYRVFSDRVEIIGLIPGGVDAWAAHQKLARRKPPPA